MNSLLYWQLEPKDLDTYAASHPAGDGCRRELNYHTCLVHKEGGKNKRGENQIAGSQLGGVKDCCVVKSRNQKVCYLSEGSSSDHLEDLEVFLMQAHLLHFGGERFGCGEKDKVVVSRQFEAVQTGPM